MVSISVKTDIRKLPMDRKFKLWLAQGQGSSSEEEEAQIADFEFDTLDEAIKYVHDHKGEASFAITYSDGSYHSWEL